ncbi:MAG: YtxH domain-containing protein [Firmicutes bacterium]|nr:YtxH domain-containing protein [Bacillota bacterium]
MMNDKTWDRVSGLIIGAAIGAIAGLLLAPKSGEETRDIIKHRTQDSVGQLQNNLQGIRDNVTQLSQKVSKLSKNVLNRGVTEISLDDDSLPTEESGENPEDSTVLDEAPHS